jgi:hypothetical protein
MAALRRGDGLQERQPPVRGPGDQHVRCPGCRGLGVLSLRILLIFPFFRRRSRRGGPVQDVHRGLVCGQHVLAGQRREHRVVEPGLPELRRHPRGGLIDPAG